ncbi:T9SS type A sorting domain-containing protein [Hanstruepera ponticola]|uniref:T9SS type A sorting domain-containing protein n=1 Tax=Hanstruepera ponticola TaxID=2042995 RepID=UPI00177BA63A|nr:T9SS type A sorting domain-containing protein [Hanstruepera ponticola]
MRKKLLFLILMLTSVVVFSQVSAGQVDDFEDGTVQNWIIGATGSSSPVNVASGGPDGVDDNFLEYTSTGAGSIGSRMAIFNANNQWSGDFISEGIVEIQFDAEVTTNDLHLRLAFQGPGGTRMISTVPVVVAASSGWNSVSLPLGLSDFTIVQGANTVSEVLSNAFTMRIISVADENIDNWRGEVIAATLRVDNITASTTLSRQDLKVENSFSIYPNPSSRNLNLNISNLEKNAQVTIYNILGAKVYSNTLNNSKFSINTSQWQKGVYLVRVSSDNGTTTKRFVKQ